MMYGIWRPEADVVMNVDVVVEKRELKRVWELSAKRHNNWIFRLGASGLITLILFAIGRLHDLYK